ncbi:MAG TPA: VWA domain-containing protein [Crocinitomix sp.]|nr:VWA domain-containing protein [Crocinitomix sp.]
MKILISLLLLFPFISLSQITVDKTKYNFGDLYDNAPTYVDFTFTNKGDKAIFLLTIDKPQEVYYLYSKKIIQPDSVMTLRLKINDKKTGRFNYYIEAYFSDSHEPIVLNLTGNVKKRSTNALTDCPDFNKQPPATGSPEFEVTVKVIDSLTREPLKRSKVYFVNNGVLVGEFYTNSNGIVHEKIPLGLYYITAEKKPYNSNFFDGYLNFQNNYVEIELQKTEQKSTPPITENQTVEVKIEKDTIKNTTNEEVEEIIDEPIEVVENPIPPKDTISLKNLPDDSFDKSHFVPNNIVFIVDVSASMNGMGKLDLLKMSMIELTKVLRPEDRVSLIAYSGHVHVLLEDISGMEKDEIIEKIQSLTAKGYTAGGDAIKEGYRLAEKYYMENGNNLIFMVTDGAFNKGDKNYKKIISKNYKKKEIKFSVVGIKTTDFLTTEMKSISHIGGGEYVRIVTINDAKRKLFEEVRRTSFKQQ